MISDTVSTDEPLGEPPRRPTPRRSNPARRRKRGTAFPSLLSWRLMLRLSQRQAADALSISQSTYARMEAGKGPPRPALGKRLSVRTGVPFEVIMGVA